MAVKASNVELSQTNANNYPVYNWLTGWSNRIQLTIDHMRVETNLTDFPVLVHLSLSSGINSFDLSAVFRVLGSDANREKIAITTSDGVTQCYGEIERWDTANKQADIWVKVPSISSTADTILYLYYDASQANNTAYIGGTGSSPAQKVWSNGFFAVYHLGEQGTGATGEYIDSTGHGNNGTAMNAAKYGAPTRTNGPGGYSQNFNGNGQYIQIPDADGFSVTTTGDLVMSFWLALNILNNPTVSKSGQLHFLQKGQSDDGEWCWVHYNQDSIQPDRDGRTGMYIWALSGGQGAGHYFTPTKDWTVGQWAFCTGKLQITNWSTLNGLLSVYENGQFKNSRYWQDSQYYIIPANGTAPVRVGTRDGSDPEWMNGKIAELRFSDVDRSNAWIQTDYFTENDNLLYYEAEINPNQYPAPVLAPINNQEINTGQLIKFSIAASNIQQGVPLIYSATKLPRGATFNASTRTFSWVPGPDQTGVYSIEFQVSDGIHKDSKVITIVVHSIDQSKSSSTIASSSNVNNNIEKNTPSYIFYIAIAIGLLLIAGTIFLILRFKNNH